MDLWQQMIFRQNTFDLDSAKSHDWIRRAIVVDVPHRISVILIGATLGGTGQMWIDSVSFEEVGPDVPLTHSSWNETPWKDLSLVVATKTRIHSQKVLTDASLRLGAFLGFGFFKVCCTLFAHGADSKK